MNIDTVIIAALGATTTGISIWLSYLKDQKQMLNHKQETMMQIEQQKYEAKAQRLVKYRESNLKELSDLLTELDEKHLDFTDHIFFMDTETNVELFDGMHEYMQRSAKVIKSLQKIKFRFGDNRLVNAINVHIKLLEKFHNIAINWNFTYSNVSANTKVDKTVPKEEVDKVNGIRDEMRAVVNEIENNTVFINERIEQLVTGYED